MESTLVIFTALILTQTNLNSKNYKIYLAHVNGGKSYFVVIFFLLLRNSMNVFKLIRHCRLSAIQHISLFFFFSYF